MSAARSSWPINSDVPGPETHAVRGWDAGLHDGRADRSWPAPVRVTTERADDVNAVGDILAAACADTPVGRLLLADRAARRRLLRQLFIHIVGWAAVHGAVYLGGDGAGAAIWLPASNTLLQNIASLDDGGAVADAFDAALIDLDGNPDLDDATHARLHALTRSLCPKVLTVGHARSPNFLLALGVDPSFRGRGVAGQLLAAHHELLDRRYAATVAVATDRAGQRLYAAAGYLPHHVDHIPATDHIDRPGPAGDGSSASRTWQSGQGVGATLQWMIRRPY